MIAELLDCPFCEPVGSGMWRGKPCVRCGGSRRISKEHLERWEKGCKMRRERMERGEHIIDAARRMGIRSHDLTLLENGWPAEPMKMRQEQSERARSALLRAS